MEANNAYIVDADREARLELHRRLGSLGISSRPFLSGSDFAAELPYLAPALVFIDVQNAGENGFDVIEAVAKAKLASPVIAMTAAADVQIAVSAIRRGAVDFLVKPIVQEELQEAVRGSCAILLQRRALAEQLESDKLRLGRLTARESEVIRLIADGHGNKAIAEQLGISVRTAESYRASAVEKLGVANASAAAALLARHDAALQAYALRVLTASVDH